MCFLLLLHPPPTQPGPAAPRCFPLPAAFWTPPSFQIAPPHPGGTCWEGVGLLGPMCPSGSAAAASFLPCQPSDSGSALWPGLAPCPLGMWPLASWLRDCLERSWMSQLRVSLAWLPPPLSRPTRHWVVSPHVQFCTSSTQDINGPSLLNNIPAAKDCGGGAVSNTSRTNG